MEEITEPLANRQELPNHPSHTTSRKIINVLEVRDAKDGTRMTAGLPRSELNLLMNGQRILEHLYRYAILNGRIYHTMTLGQGLMNSYAYQLLPEQRWAVIHYVRALQKAARPTETDLAAAKRSNTNFDSDFPDTTKAQLWPTK